MAELRGKGWRVLGFFLWMLGAGILLDSEAVRCGAVLLVAGGGMFLFGVVQSAGEGTRGEGDG